MKGQFAGISDSQVVKATSTEVQIRHGGEQVFGSYLNLQGRGNTADFDLRVDVAEGDTIDFIVDPFHNYQCDTTGLDATITLQ